MFFTVHEMNMIFKYQISFLKHGSLKSDGLKVRSVHDLGIPIGASLYNTNLSPHFQSLFFFYLDGIIHVPLHHISSCHRMNKFTKACDFIHHPSPSLTLPPSFLAPLACLHLPTPATSLTRDILFI